MGRHTQSLTVMSGSHPRSALVALILLAAIALFGCAGREPGAAGVNVPPETRLTFAPDNGDTTGVKVTLSWTGFDADGEVACYWTRLDGSPWRRTASAETILVLSSESSSNDNDDERTDEPHVFKVRAEDDAGDVDPSPASVTFTARNSLPETEIVHGPSGVTAPYAFFEWRGWDYDGIVAAYAWELYYRESSVAEWVLVAERDGIPPDEVSVTFGPMLGRHRFDVRSIDDEGGEDPTPATREFYCIPDFAPVLALETNVLGDHVFMRFDCGHPYDQPTDVFEGDHLVFNWTASAADYGGTIAGYSYAFDDTTDWCSTYDLDDTHFEASPAQGEHSLYVSVVDTWGQETRCRVFVNVVPVAREHVLLVDDFDWRESFPPEAGWGTDEMRDAFYDTLTMACSRPVVVYDVAENGGEPPGVPELAQATTVIWYYDDDDPALEDAFDAYPLDYPSLAGYARVGGNLILAGFRGVGHMIGDVNYPISMSPTDTDGARVFIRDQLGIGYVENSGANQNKNSPWTYGFCFYGAVPTYTSVPDGGRGDFVAVYIDSVGPGGYPEPGKWPVYVSANPSVSRGGLFYVEATHAYGDAIEIGAIDAYLNMNFEGEPCIVLRYTGTDRGNSCYFGFPLYYTQTEQAVAFFEELLRLFGE